MADKEKLIEAIEDIASETFRLRGVFMRVMRSAEPDEQKKYMSQFAWFEKRVCRAMEEADVRVVDLTGQKYDPGMPVTPLNIDDFDSDSVLVIERMTEPVIMLGERLSRTGTVMLKEEQPCQAT